MVACIGGTRICLSHIQVLVSFIEIIKILELSSSLAAWLTTCQQICKIYISCVKSSVAGVCFAKV